MKHSESMDKILPALLDVQANLKPVAKNDTNPHFHSKFANLEAINEAVQPLLVKNSLVVTHTMSVLSDGSSGLTTTLWHVSGQFISGEMPLLLAKEDPQGQGSGITYARRYAIAALLNLVQADDDGQQATDSRQAHPQQQPQQQRKPVAPTPDGQRKPTCVGCGLVQPVMKSQYGTGWYCNKNRGGCGAKFEDGEVNAPVEVNREALLDQLMNEGEIPF